MDRDSKYIALMVVGMVGFAFLAGVAEAYQAYKIQIAQMEYCAKQGGSVDKNGNCYIPPNPCREEKK